MANTKTYYDTLASVAQVADTDIIVVQTADNSSLESMKKAKVQAIRQPILDMIASNAKTAASNDGSYVSGINVSASGEIEEVLKSFDTSITESTATAPTSKAVKDYVEGEITGTIADNISSAVNALDATTKGGNAKYIKSISEENGKIIATEQNLVAVSNDANNAPSASEVKRYVDDKISALNVAEIGNFGTLIQSIKEDDGKISASTIDIDSSIDASKTGIPTTTAVDTRIHGLNGRVGVEGEGYLVESVTETGGVITGTKIKIDRDLGDLNNDRTGIPTTTAVKNAISNTLLNALGGIDYTSQGEDGKFVQKVNQEDGKISEIIVDFENNGIRWVDPNTSEFRYSSRADVAPTVKAVTDVFKEIDTAITAASAGVAGLNYSAPYVDGKFIGGVGQVAGQLGASYASFLSSVPASATAAEGVVAPSANAVRKEINALTYTASPKAGSFIAGIEQEAGKISASYASFLDTIPATTGNNGKDAPSANAVRKAINDLDVATKGANGSYIKYVSETDGKISAETKEFDHYSRGESWSATPSDNNAPSSLAVENRIEEAKRQILEESEGMTYRGAVSSVSTLTAAAASWASKASKAKKYDCGDTYIANADFNLSTGITYAVRSGDMLIVKETKDSFAASNFDIIGGSDKTVLFEGTGAVSANVPIFTGTSGRSIIDSGYSFASMASYASVASKAAASAASSASLASSEVIPYKTAAASAATAATGYELKAKTGSTASTGYEYAAKTGSTAATGYKNDAYTAATAATGYELKAKTGSTAVASYQTGAGGVSTLATGYEYNAKTAATAATGYENVAKTASTKAPTYVTGAQTAATAATGYENTAKTAATAATGYENTAKTASTGAPTYITGAQTAATSAASYETAAKNSRNNATGYENSAKTAATAATGYEYKAKTASTGAPTYITGAQTAAESAASYETAAKNSRNNATGYENSAKTAAESATGYENTAKTASTGAPTYITGAQTAAESATGYENTAKTASTGATDYKNTAKTAAESATGYENTAKTASTKAPTYITGAQTAATSAASYETAAKNSKNTATGYENSAKTAATAAASWATTAGGALTLATGYANDAKTAATAATGYENTAKTAATAATAAVSTATSAAITAATAAALTAATSAVDDKMPKSGGTFSGTVYFGSTAYSVNTSGAAKFAAVSGTSFTATSSKKVKENISPAAISALDLIKTVDVVNFNYIADEEKTPHIGFIAEDTDSLLSTPHLNGMDYTNCIGVLLKAVQEITQGLASLAKKVE